MPTPRVAVLSALAVAWLSGGGGPASGEGRPAAEPALLAAALVEPAAGLDPSGPAPEARGCGLVPRFSEDIAFHGPITGDAEKDSVGFLLSGHDGCPGAPIR